MKVATKKLLEEQIAAVVVPGRGEKSDAKWHVPQREIVVFGRHRVLWNVWGKCTLSHEPSQRD